MTRSRFRRSLIWSGAAAALPGLLAGCWPARSVTAPPAAATASTAAMARTMPAAMLAAVSCTSPGTCVAVGNVASGQWVTHTLAEAWSGGRWRVLATPNPNAVSSYLYGVACRSATSCVAVGATIASSGWRALAETWNGSSWRLVPPVFPAGAQSSDLFDVACGGPLGGTCLAVGSYTDSQGKVQPLTESLAAGRWQTLKVPVPLGHARASLNGLSCSGSSCLAVGSAQDSAGKVGVLAETWVNGAWRPATLPGPAGAQTAVGQDVSCVRGACVVVGYASSPARTAPLPLADSLASGRWRVSGSLSPAGALLNGVSCPVPNWCAAVGGATSGREPITETWDGTAWRLIRPPIPAGAKSAFLSQVSCPSRSSCLAVGGSYGPAGRGPLAAAWNGARWVLLAAPPA